MFVRYFMFKNTINEILKELVDNLKILIFVIECYKWFNNK